MLYNKLLVNKTRHYRLVLAKIQTLASNLQTMHI